LFNRKPLLQAKPELPDDTLITNIDLPTRIANALHRSGMQTVADIREADDRSILSLPDLGKGSLKWLRQRRTVIGYARVSTTDQNLDAQESTLRAAGCDVIRSEKRSGTTTTGREELRTVLDFLRSGDVLMVTRIDRLARSIGDLQVIVRTVRARGASLRATEQPIDTSTAAGKCFLDMLGVFAEFETNLRRERQLEGIAEAKARGVYQGRKASIDTAKVKALKAEGMGASAIAKALKIGRASVYRALED
jgi:DNA invertase Pin-like site-specific DNA recombinase